MIVWRAISWLLQLIGGFVGPFRSPRRRPLPMTGIQTMRWAQWQPWTRRE